MKNNIMMLSFLAIGVLYSCSAPIENRKTDNHTPLAELTELDSKLSVLQGTSYVFYNEKDLDEIIYVVIAADGKDVTHCIYTDKTTDKPVPITLMRMEYSEDIDMYLGVGKCPELGGEGMLSIEGDLSKLGWNDGKLKKTFLRKE
jgi:hypothetical protein